MDTEFPGCQPSLSTVDKRRRAKDRRYLRFIGKVLKFTLILLVVILVFFFFERLVAPML